MPKPSPMQGRVLRALRDTEPRKWHREDHPLSGKNYLRLFKSRRGKYFEVEHNLTGVKRKILVSTAQALWNNGWVKEIPNYKYAELYVYLEITEKGRKAIAGWEEEDYNPPDPEDRVTADEIKDALGKRHDDPEKSLLIFEFYPTTGGNWNAPRRYDAVAFEFWKSNGFRRIVYEIKVSRGDFLAEIRDPEKRQPAMEFANQFFFVVPVGLVKKNEVPEGCGLIMVNADAESRIVRSAPIMNENHTPEWGLVASLVRHAYRKGWAYGMKELKKSQEMENEKDETTMDDE